MLSPHQIHKHLASESPPPSLNPPFTILPLMNTKKPTRNSKSNPKTNNLKPPAKCTQNLQDIEDFSPQEAQLIRSSLLGWYDKSQRDLPWRTQKGGVEERAYAVWVSEVMLQQTRVSTVVGYYNRWMEKWPSVRHLADASLEEVNEMWAGLGYYRRARFLLEGAKAIVEGGEFPPSAAELRKVRGIGEYTAGAIASIAFNEAVPVVDGNVVRVITRLRAISANPKETATKMGIWKLAGQLVDPSRPGDFNQAIMELGATLCSITSPNCSSCPVSDQCRALSLSTKSKTVKVTNYPTKVVKAKQRNDFAAVCIVEIVECSDTEVLRERSSKHRYLLVMPEEGLLAGLWEFPSVLLEEEKTDMGTRRRTMDEYLKTVFDIDVAKKCKVILREDVGEYLHVFSHIQLRMHVELLILYLEDVMTNKKGFNCPVTLLIVDGNVVRVITRLRAISANPKETATKMGIWKLAGQLVDPSRPGDFNQAIMELGATLCSVTSPNCSSCPVSDQCRALSLSTKSKTVKVTNYPTKVVKAKQRNDFAAVCIVEIVECLDTEVLRERSSKRRYLLVKRPEEGLLAGLWEFPSVLLEEEKTDMGTRRRTMDEYLNTVFDIDVAKKCKVILREDVGEYLHVFSHIRLRMHVELLILNLEGELNHIDAKNQSAITWKCVDGDSINSMGLTSSVRKVYNMTQDFKQKQFSQPNKIAARKRIKRSTLVF